MFWFLFVLVLQYRTNSFYHRLAVCTSTTTCRDMVMMSDVILTLCVHRTDLLQLERVARGSLQLYRTVSVSFRAAYL